MQRDEVLAHAAKLENLGINVGRPDKEPGKFHPRQALLQQLERALAVKHLQPILVGAHGVEKTTLVTMLARKLNTYRPQFRPKEGSIDYRPFFRVTCVMTSNVGYGSIMIDLPIAGEAQRRWEQRAIGAARRAFRAELLDRLTDILVFKSLTREQVAVVARREIERLAARGGVHARGLRVILTPNAFDAVVDAGYSPELGAREMERAVERKVGVAVARFLAEHPDAQDQDVLFDVAGDGLVPILPIPSNLAGARTCASTG